MNEEDEVDGVDKLVRRIYLSVATGFFAIGIAFVAASIWSILRFKACQQTVVCDDDVFPPAISIGVGLLAIVVSQMFLGPQRRLAGERGGPRAYRVIGIMLLATGLGLLALVLQQRFAGASLQYYQWMAQHGTSPFAFDLTCDGLAIAIGALLIYRYSPRRSPEASCKDHG